MNLVLVKNIKDVGNILKNNRELHRFSQEYLSKISGVEQAQISKIESNKLDGITFGTILKLASALNIEIYFSSEEKQNIKPFVKWAGGKTQLLSELLKYIPNKFNTYFEPFVGGGALLFALQPKSFVINDSNVDLISAYRMFLTDDNVRKLMIALSDYEMHHSANPEQYYYSIRNMDSNPEFRNINDDRLYATRLIYLNKACFNGLYRTNSRGQFNVPFGKKSVVKLYDRNNFLNISQYFMNSNAVIENIDYAKSVQKAKKEDFVYFDPPYDNSEEKHLFTTYNGNSFGKQEQIRLFETFKELSNKGVYCMLSNSNTEFIRNLYKDYNIHEVYARRNINSKGGGRGKVSELIITNY